MVLIMLGNLLVFFDNGIGWVEKIFYKYKVSIIDVLKVLIFYEI